MIPDILLKISLHDSAKGDTISPVGTLYTSCGATDLQDMEENVRRMADQMVTELFRRFKTEGKRERPR